MSNSPSGIKAPSKSKISRPIGNKSDTDSLSRSSSVSTLASVAESKEPDEEIQVDFNVGEKVWVNGTKPGIIQYIGKTEFAPGIWAGISLDDPVGKNDGSVNGVKYFTCEPLKGIFIRPHRLTRQAGSPQSLIGDTSVRLRESAVQSHLAKLPPTPKSSLISPNRHLCSKLKPGDRVLVSSANGFKSGILRFVGSTDFAVGEWAGVELDLPVGKNDGSVGGKRYFKCDMKRGLFAPISKISRESGLSTSQTPSLSGSIRNRSFSRESLSSAGSLTSSKSARVKLGINSLGTSQKSPGTTTTNKSVAQTALQEALKEKQEHIEQLLKERDLDREEIAKAANQVTETEQRLASFQKQHDSIVLEKEAKMVLLKEQFDKIDAERKQFSSKLDEEKRKIEDLQFRLDEETILKGELKSQAEKERIKIKELEEFVSSSSKNEVSAEQSNKLADMLKEKENEISSLKSEVEKLNTEIKSKDEQATQMMSSLAEAKQRSLSLESDSLIKVELENKLKNLEQEAQNLSTNKGNLEEQLSSLKNSLNQYEIKEREKISEISQLKTSLQMKEEEISKLSIQIEENNNIIASQGELEKECLELKNNNEIYVKESLEKETYFKKEIDTLTGEKEDLESKLQNHVEILKTKDADVSKLSQELECSRKEMSLLNQGQSEQVSGFQKSISDLKNEINKMTEDMVQKENSYKSELENLSQEQKNLGTKNNELIANLETKDNVLNKLKQELEESTRQITSVSQGNSELLLDLQNKITELKSEIENAKSEQQQNEQNYKSELDKLSKEKNILEKANSDLTNTVEIKTSEFEKLHSELNESKNEIARSNQLNSDQVSSLQNNISQLTTEIENLKSNLEQKEQQLSSEAGNLLQEKQKLESEICNLTSTLNDKSNDLEKVKNDLEESRKEITILSQGNSEQVSGLQNKLSEMKSEIDSLKTDLQQKEKNFKAEIGNLSGEKQSLQDNNHNLVTSLETRDKELSELKIELENFTKQISLLNQGNSDLNATLETQIAELKDKIKKIIEEKEELSKLSQEQQQSLNSKLEEKSALLVEKEQFIEGLRKDISAKETVLSDLKAATESNQSQWESMVSEKEKQLQSQIANIQSTTEAALKENEECVASLELKISELTATLQTNQEDTKQKQQEIENLKSAVNEKENQIDELGKLVQRSQNQLEELKTQNNDNMSLLESRVSEFKTQQEKHFLEKEKTLHEEIGRLNLCIEKKDLDLQLTSTEVNNLRTKESSLTEELVKLQLFLKSCEADQNNKFSQEVAMRENLEKQLKSTKVQCDKLQLENEEALKQLKVAQISHQELEKCKNSLLQDNQKQLLDIKDRESKLELVQKEVERMRKEFTQHKETLQSKLDISETELKAMKEFKDQLELQHSVFEELQKQLDESEKERNQMREKLQKNSYNESKEWDEKLKQVQDKLHKTEVKLGDEASINKSLRTQIDSKDALIKLQNEEIESLQITATNKTDSAEVAKLRNEFTNLKTENAALLADLQKLRNSSNSKTALTDITSDNTEEKDAILKENENLKYQVEFLNSIIVDMKKKNEELTKQLEPPAFVEKDLNLNGGFKAPRFFCDICDMFDLHDTEDCPKQCSIEDDEVTVPHSKHNGKRNVERPYCNNCEMFDHWTIDCDQEETF